MVVRAIRDRISKIKENIAQRNATQTQRSATYPPVRCRYSSSVVPYERNCSGVSGTKKTLKLPLGQMCLLSTSVHTLRFFGFENKATFTGSRGLSRWCDVSCN